MKEITLSSETNTIYPGSYVPPVNEKQWQPSGVKKLVTGASPPFHVREQGGMFLLEIAIPGVKKEEIYIETFKDDLAVHVCHRTYHTAIGPDNMLFDLMEQHIRLPNTAETSFVAAEYTAGVLYMHLPKSGRPLKNGHSIIVVY